MNRKQVDVNVTIEVYTSSCADSKRTVVETAYKTTPEMRTPHSSI